MSVSGKFMSAFVGTTEVADNYGWTATADGELGDRTTGADEGWEREDALVARLHATIKGFWDIVTGNVAGLQFGAILTDVGLYTNRDDAEPFYAIGEAIVARFQITGATKERILWECEIHSRGPVVTQNNPG